MTIIKSFALFATSLVLGAGVAAAVTEPVFFPAKGQTTEQMTQDKIYCQGWAQEQTKHSDTANATVNKQGSAVKGAAKTAAVGAAIGAAAGNAGKGAAVGAAVGGASGRRRANQAEAQQKQATTDYYYRSLSGCMEGKGYTVK
jgi:hypothetical protein